MRFDIRDYTLQAGIDLPLEMTGKYFTLVRTDYPVNINAYSANSQVGEAIGLEQGAIVPVLPLGFDRLKIRSTLSQAIRLAIADDPVTIFTLAGTIGITDLKKTETDNEQAFYHNAAFEAFNSTYKLIGVRNPVGSGVVVYVDRVRFRANVDVDIAVGIPAVEPSFLSQAHYKKTEFPFSFGGNTVVDAGTLSAGAVYAMERPLLYESVLAGKIVEHSFDNPISIPEGVGYGISIFTNPATGNYSGLIEGREVAV